MIRLPSGDVSLQEGEEQMAEGPARIVVAERWSVLRRGLIGVLQSAHTVVDELDDAGDVGKVVANRPVDVAILGDEVGLDLAHLVKDLAGRPDAPPLVVLSDDMDVARLRGVLRAGAKAVFSKRVDDDTLLDGVARVLVGDRVIDQRFLPLLFGGENLSADPADDEPSLLTPRERDVLQLLARGCSNREIADLLVLGESTIKTHLRRIYTKLEADGRHQAVGRAMELGLLH